jgi:NAD(P)-dependent dehydrogenase (short-subunit alcohol dehydrogenase family)
LDNLRGRTAFITGGASGIGLAVGRALAADGVRVALADVDEAELNRARDGFSGQVTGVVLDVRDRAAWARARAETEAKLGPVDILMNNAGIGPDGRELADMNPASFDRLIAVNLTGVFNGVSEFAGSMRARRSGHIVNTASMAGLISAVGLGAYTISKFGVVGLSEVLRSELAPHGVGVSVLCPGMVVTRLRESTLRLGGEVLNKDQAAMGEGVDPSFVSERVLAGIKGDWRYILTHGEYRGAVEARVERLLEAFAETPPSPQYQPDAPLPGSPDPARP